MSSPGYHGLVAIDYRGTRHVLGRTYNAYAIWDRAAGGVPIRLFALSAEGWSGAWSAFRELEGEGVGPDEWLGARPDALQPMFAGGIVGRAFRLWGRHFLTLVAIGAVVIVPLQGLLFVANALTVRVVTSRTFGIRQVTPDTPLWVDVLNNLIPFVLLALLSGAMVTAVALILLGRRPSVGLSYRVGLRFALRLLSLAIVQSVLTLLIMTPALVAFAAYVATGSDGLLVLAVILVLVLLVPAIFIAIKLTLAPTALVLEGLGPIRALRRSWELVRGVFWRIFGTLVLIGLIGGGVGLLLIMITIPFTGLDLTPERVKSFFVITTGITALAQLALGPLGSIALVLLYLDARVRKEAYSIEDLERDLPGRG